MVNKVSESIFSDDSVVIPLSDVLFVEKHYYGTPSEYKGIRIIFKGTKWDMEADTWSNNAYISDIDDKHKKFLKAWCRYRYEIEGGKDAFISPED